MYKLLHITVLTTINYLVYKSLIFLAKSTNLLE